jgi:hypothetical protein
MPGTPPKKAKRDAWPFDPGRTLVLLEYEAGYLYTRVWLTGLVYRLGRHFV